MRGLTIEVPALEYFRLQDYEKYAQGEKVEWIEQMFEMLDESDETYRKYQVDWEPARKGRWTLSKGDIPKHAYERLHHVIEGGFDLERDCGHGPITVLKQDGKVWMSDTRAEVMEHAPLFNALWWAEVASGTTVLINGLGLGVAVKAALRRAEHVDVVEIDQDVIDIIAPNFTQEVKEGRLTIHHADAHEIEWPDDKKWTLAWHDIWPNIDSANLASMDILEDKYSERVDWQESWQRAGCEKQADQIARLKEALQVGDWALVKKLDPEF